MKTTLIPFNDLSKQYVSIQKHIDPVIAKTLKRGIFILGENVELFEKEFCSFLGARFAIGVGSGTDALTLALRALDVTNRDEVLVPANSYPSVFGILMSGVRVRLVDVLPDGTMDPKDIVRKCTPNTKAIIPVHLYGNAASIHEVCKIAKAQKQKVYVIEDCAQAHGLILPHHELQTGSRDNPKQFAGTVGDIGCFSFYPTKNLGAYGDGGMIVTNNKTITERIRQLRMYGEVDRYKSREISGVSRLDELQAAVLRVKLKFLEAWTKRRRCIAKLYRDGLTSVGDVEFLHGDNIHSSVYHLFVLRTKKRDSLKKYLESRGIGVSIHYPYTIHQTQSMIHELRYHTGDFPVSESMAHEILSLPMYPELTDREVKTVVTAVRSFFA